MYNIKVNYSERDSFKESKSEELLGPYRDIDIAIANAKHIRKHYDVYEKMNSAFGFGKTRQEAEAAKKKLEEDNPWYDEHKITLKKDDGTEEQIYVRWVGWGERLEEITVVLAEMKF